MTSNFPIFSGKGDLVGCDITKHWEAASTHDDVVVKSSADVRALTYCDLKVDSICDSYTDNGDNTPSPWFVRVSLVRFSFVRIFKTTPNIWLMRFTP